MDADGRNIRNLPQNPANRFAIRSPDVKQIAFNTDRDGNVEVAATYLYERNGRKEGPVKERNS